MAGGFAVSDIDIVTRLRMLAQGLLPITEQVAMREAADEIERLRRLLLAEENNSDIHRRLYEVAVAERDEARREVCRFAGNHLPTMRIEAVWRGWDCFKEAP
jgi:hypothetical protein